MMTCRICYFAFCSQGTLNIETSFPGSSWLSLNKGKDIQFGEISISAGSCKITSLNGKHQVIAMSPSYVINFTYPTSHKSSHSFLFFFLLDCWDCVVTCFFIDTAHNVISYIENIAKILKPGGYWINFGNHNFCSLIVNGSC